MAFTAQEKSRIKRFLSYPDWVALASSIQLGFPAGSEPLFLVERAFGAITTYAEESVRRDLCECEAIECQLSEARSRFKVVQLGELKINPNETRMLRKELLYWVTRLADDLGVVPDPYSQMLYNGINNMGGINARVVG